MSRYSAQDLLLPPSLVSLLRVPLAVLFFSYADDDGLALGILALAGLSDIIDGWLARRNQQATPTGAVVDGVVDKVFAGTVVVTLVLKHDLSLSGALALATRELLELPLVLWWSVRPERREARAAAPMANWLGKLATVVQFAAVASVMVQPGWAMLLLVLTAVFGALAALKYWQRELRIR